MSLSRQFFRNNRFKSALIFILLLGSVFGYRMFWWSVGSGGEMGDNGGMTVGQTAAGDVAGTTHGASVYGFWVPELSPVICFNIDHDTWDIDSVDVYTTTSMVLSDEILVSNCGNCAINFGLRYISSAPLVWNAAYMAGNDRFVIRGQFTDALVPPTVYSPSGDYINDILNWCNGTRFGAFGMAVAPSDASYLWFQFISPSSSTLYGEDLITLGLYAQQNLP